MEHQPLGNIFRELMFNYDIAIGFEESVLDREHNDFAFETRLPERKVITNINEMYIPRHFYVKGHWITLNVENEGIEEVFDQIVGQMENYKWEINDDVVNIYPVRGRDKRYEELLKLNIQHFQMEKGEQLKEIRRNLLGLSELIKFLGKNEIYTNGSRGDMENLRVPLTVELKFSNLNLRDLLNKISKAKRGGWILQRHKVWIGDGNKEFIDIVI